MMEIKQFTFNPFAENTYLVSSGKKAMIIDPGMYDRQENEILVKFVLESELEMIHLINTHCHIDHVFGNEFIARKYGLELEIHKDEIPVLNIVPQVAQAYGLKYTPSPDPKIFLEPGKTIKLGDSNWEIRYVPGHAPGHIILIEHSEKVIIAGDTIFERSIGRTDLPGGNHDTLINKIKSEILTLPDDFIIYPGHGNSTDVGSEKTSNPFLI